MNEAVRLQAAWARLATEPPRSPCPDPVAIYDAFAGTSPLAEREAIVPRIAAGGAS